MADDVRIDMSAACSKNILLASVGLGGPRKTRYELDSRTVEAPFSAFGLWQLLDESSRPSEIWFLLTPRARKDRWGAIEEEAKRLEVAVRPVDLSGDMDDTRQFLEQAATAIPEGCRLTLDVTQGLRHHAFLFYALAIYLSAFRNVQIDGVWYCRLETENRDDPKPLIDLKPTLDLAHWFHALAVFRETGLPRAMARLLHREFECLRDAARSAGNDRQMHERARHMRDFAGAFERYSFGAASGLPLELGKVARWILDSIDQFAETEAGRRLPLARSLADRIAEEAGSVAFPSRPAKGGNWKCTISLTWSELQREAALIDAYLDREQYALAVGLMREWVISWLMWRHRGESASTTNHHGVDSPKDEPPVDDEHATQAETASSEPASIRWLPYAQRKPFEQWLGSLGTLIRNDGTSVRIELSDECKAFVQFWNQLSGTLRNTFHHHGMREEGLEKPPATLMEVRQFWGRLKRNEIDPPRVGGGGKTLLLCPIGLTPGVLYSALHHTRPDRVLVICSEASRSKVEQAVERSGQGPRVEYLVLRDVHTGIGEFPKLIDEASPWLFEADEIEANLTGGTTLMGVLVNELVKRARGEYQRPVREFVLIDRRTPEEQRNDPWVVGEIRYLDGEPANNGTNGRQGSGASEETN